MKEKRDARREFVEKIPKKQVYKIDYDVDIKELEAMRRKMWGVSQEVFASYLWISKSAYCGLLESKKCSWVLRRKIVDSWVVEFTIFS